MSVGRSKRFKVLERDHFTCVYCGRSAPDVVLEVDHIEPRSNGGSDSIGNLVSACYDCNRGKRDRDSQDQLVTVDWITSLKRDLHESEQTIGRLRDLLVEWEVFAEERGWIE